MDGPCRALALPRAAAAEGRSGLCALVAARPRPTPPRPAPPTCCRAGCHLSPLGPLPRTGLAAFDSCTLGCCSCPWEPRDHGTVGMDGSLEALGPHTGSPSTSGPALPFWASQGEDQPCPGHAVPVVSRELISLAFPCPKLNPAFVFTSTDCASKEWAQLLSGRARASVRLPPGDDSLALRHGCCRQVGSEVAFPQGPAMVGGWPRGMGRRLPARPGGPRGSEAPHH